MKQLHKKRYLFLIYIIWLILILPSIIWADVKRLKFQGEGNYLIVEALDDDLIHFEYGRGAGPSTRKPIKTTDMVCNKEDKLPSVVCKTDFLGPTGFSNKGSGSSATGPILENLRCLILVVDISLEPTLMPTISLTLDGFVGYIRGISVTMKNKDLL